jgi:hypothetical protein
VSEQNAISSNIEDVTFGVEIETTIPFGIIAVGGYHAGRPVIAHPGQPPAPTFNGASWKAERDGSIQIRVSGHQACEFVSPVLKGEAGVRHLIEMVEWIRSIGGKVNTSCGLHIHLGLEGARGGEEAVEYVDRLARLAAFNATALYAQTGSAQRATNSYCRPADDSYQRAVRVMKKSKVLVHGARTNRYTLLNLTNIPSRGTVEFRCFCATLNATKVLAHLFSCIALAFIARTAKTPATWNNKGLTGVKAVTNFFKVRPMTRIVQSPTFAAQFPAMVRKALELAQQFDAGRLPASTAPHSNDTRIAAHLNGNAQATEQTFSETVENIRRATNRNGDR